MTALVNKNAYKVEINNRDILKMALPISLSILVPQINFITNNIFLGHLGEESLAVAGITGVYYLLFAVIGNGLNSGMQALIARRAGEGQIGEVGRLFSQGMLICFGFAATGIVLTYFAAPYVLSFSLHSQPLREEAIRFLQIRIWGLVFLYVYQLRNAVLVGTNQSRFLVYGTLAETIVNITLDYALIFGHLGLPALGFNGAAYSSILAELTGLLVIFGVIQAKGIGRDLHLFKHWGFQAAPFRLILTQSSPVIFQYGISILAWVFFYILVEHHGRLDLAVSNTMRNIFGIFGVFTWAFAASANAMVSNIIGQGKEDRVLELIGKILRLSMGLAFILALILNLFPGVFLSIYGQDPGFTRAAIPVIQVVSVALIMQSFAAIWLNAITGTGNTRIGLLIEIITLLFYCIYIYLVLERWRLSMVYGWISEWLYWTLTFSLAYAYFRTGWWKGKVI